MAKLIVIGMPIGNPLDLSIRALAIFKETTVFFVEDTRSFLNYLKFLNNQKFEVSLDKKKIYSYFQEQEFKKIDSILSFLKEGVNVGLVSQAGMPTISDPGSQIIRAVAQEQFEIEVIPGISSPTLATVYSGFESQVSAFVGFLPKKATEKENFLSKIKLAFSKFRSVSIIFFDNPDRIIETVNLFNKLFSGQRLFLAKNLTKKDERLFRIKLGKDKLVFSESGGEWTGVIELRKML